MPNVMNQIAVGGLMQMARIGNIDTKSNWSFSAADGNDVLGPNSGTPDWDRYASVHMGRRAGVSRTTKEAWVYPVAKYVNGQMTLFRSGLVAVRQRASQQRDNQIFRVAGQMIAVIDAREKRDKARSG